MDDLIIRSLQGRATKEDELRLLRWRRGAPENEGHYRTLRELWVLMGRGEKLARTGAPPDPEAIVVRAESEAEREKGVAPVPIPLEKGSGRAEGGDRRWMSPLAAGALAAALAILGFGVGLFADRPLGTLVSDQPAGQMEVATGPGELTMVTLPDGTGIRVGPSSRLRVWREGAEWTAWLDGRAFFGVQPDSARTFIVQTSYGEAVVLGTRFEVRTEAEEFRVLVVEGNVRVSAGDESVEVGEGVMSLSRAGGPPTTAFVPDMDRLLQWMGRTLLFRETAFERAMAEIGSRYGVEVEMEDEALLSLTVTATFTEQSMESVVSVICEIVGADCPIEGDRIRVRSRRPDAPAPIQ